ARRGRTLNEPRRLVAAFAVGAALTAGGVLIGAREAHLNTLLAYDAYERICYYVAEGREWNAVPGRASDVVWFPEAWTPELLIVVRPFFPRREEREPPAWAGLPHEDEGGRPCTVASGWPWRAARYTKPDVVGIGGATAGAVRWPGWLPGGQVW